MLPRQRSMTKERKKIPHGKAHYRSERIKTLTDPIIKGLKPRAASFEIADAVVPGLFIRVQPSGFKGYSLHARPPGKFSRGSRSPATARSRLPTFAISLAIGSTRLAEGMIRR